MTASGADDVLTQVASAYQGLEDEAAFPDRAALLRYRDDLLLRTGEQTEFLSRRLPVGAAVLEAACGNGRLLLSLAAAGLAAEGLGVDIAASRIEFARRWAADNAASGIAFEVADLLETQLPESHFDAAALITGALAYFGPAGEEVPLEVLVRLRRALKPGALLVLELYPHVRERQLLDAAGGAVRIWRELSEDDPWRFYLSDLQLDGDVLTHRKTFVHRTSGVIDEGRCEYLTLYGPRQLHELLDAAGFTDVVLHDGWSEGPYRGGELIVVTARSGR